MSSSAALDSADYDYTSQDSLNLSECKLPNGYEESDETSKTSEEKSNWDFESILGKLSFRDDILNIDGGQKSDEDVVRKDYANKREFPVPVRIEPNSGDYKCKKCDKEFSSRTMVWMHKWIFCHREGCRFQIRWLNCMK